MADQTNLLIGFLTSADPNFKLSHYMKTIKSMETLLERVNFVYKDLQKYGIFFDFEEDLKNDNVSTTKREKGNDFFKAGKYREALDCYTSSVLTAKSQNVLALAYANRSAVLFRLNFHQECVTEIKRAFENDYPAEKKKKLLRRQKEAKAKVVINQKYHEQVPKFSDSEKNTTNPAARNSIHVVTNKLFGRHVLATRDIKIGEILLIEEPSAAVINSQRFVHCHECFELCYNPLPCNYCTQALYCSSNCRDRSFSTYHKYECPILLTLNKKIDDVKILAVKMVFLSQNLDLETHTEKLSDDYLFVRTVIACGLFHLIKNYTDFFENGFIEDDTKELILKSMLVNPINSVNIRELSPHGAMGFSSFNPFASAIYPTLSLFNHSCCPNVFLQNYGSTVVLRAFSTIKEGEQCFISYSPRYWDQIKDKRTAFLSEQLFFTCHCRACEEDWPTTTGTSLRDTSDSITFLKLLQMDIDTAKKELKRILTQTKKSEEMLPAGKDWFSKMLMQQCFYVFGKKRRI